MKEKRDSDLQDIQKKSIEILMVFKEFCEKHGLLFYLCGGCCIGAVRHKGFIPWDDDIDVFMPRDDYETLARLWPEEMADTKYRYCRSSRNEFCRSLVAAISDESTAFIKKRQADLDISHGVRLEILPLDGCPASRWKRKLQLCWALIYQIYINQEAPVSKGRIANLAGRIMLALCPGWKLRFYIAEYAQRHMSKYSFGSASRVTELCARFDPMLREYPAEAFKSAVYMTFEGLEIPVPAGYDTYLNMAFGDYMKLPPNEERKPKHDTVQIDPEHSYRIYKGTFYCRQLAVKRTFCRKGTET